MAGDLSISTINGEAIGTKNVIINGGFNVNQRAVSGTVTLAAGVYGHDRWKAGASGVTYTFAISANVTMLTITAGSLIQVVEGLNLYTDTYSLSWTGTAQGKIGAGSFAGSGVTGSITGGTNTNIEFGTGTVSQVQLEAGAVVTLMERRDYGRELIMCQRYYYRIAAEQSSGVRVGSGYNTNTNTSVSTIQFPVTMRTFPTALETTGNASDYHVAYLTTSTACNAVPNYSNQTSSTSARFDSSVSSGLTAGQGIQARIVTLNAFLAWSAEL
jgi:hypothetical protein